MARMRDALAGEMNRRQQLLRAAGCASVAAYEDARRAGAQLTAAADVVHRRRRVLRTAQPASRFRRHVRRDRPARPVAGYASVAGQSAARRGPAARAGSSPVVSAVPENAVCRRITNRSGNSRTHTNCRIRPARASCAAVGRRAGPLPDRVRFGTAARRRAGCVAESRQRLRCGCSPHGPLDRVARSRPRRSSGRPARTVLQVVLDRLSGHGPPAHQVWLPPLGAAPPLDALLSRRRIRAGRPDRAHRHRRPSVRAVPDAADGRLIRSRRQCRDRRRTAIGQVDGAAHTDHRAGGHSRSGPGAVLLPGFRRRRRWRRCAPCRTWALSPAGPSRSWSGAWSPKWNPSSDLGRPVEPMRWPRRSPVRSTFSLSSTAGRACAMSSKALEAVDHRPGGPRAFVRCTCGAVGVALGGDQTVAERSARHPHRVAAGRSRRLRPRPQAGAAGPS